MWIITNSRLSFDPKNEADMKYLDAMGDILLKNGWIKQDVGSTAIQFVKQDINKIILEGDLNGQKDN